MRTTANDGNDKDACKSMTPDKNETPNTFDLLPSLDPTILTQRSRPNDLDPTLETISLTPRLTASTMMTPTFDDDDEDACSFALRI
jgi:hypothetical protein